MEQRRARREYEADEARRHLAVDGNQHALRIRRLPDDGGMHGRAAALDRRRPALRARAEERAVAGPRFTLQVRLGSLIRLEVRERAIDRAFRAGPGHRRAIPELSHALAWATPAKTVPQPPPLPLSVRPVARRR